VTHLHLLGLLALAVIASACVGGATHTMRAGRKATAPGPVRIVLADAADQRGTVVTLGRHPAVRSVTLPGRSGGDPPVSLAAVGGGVVFYGANGVYALPGSLVAPSRRIHRGLYFVPSASPGRVWVAIQDPRRPGERLVRRVVEVTTGGKTVISPAHRPPGRNILGALRAGLVIQTRSGLAVWDPRTGSPVRRLPGPFAAALHGNLIAWCASGCPTMHITDAADGSDRVVPHVRHVPWEASYDGAFSADGRYLALPIKAGRAERVVLIDVRADTSRLIGGPRPATIYPLFGWAPDGDTLYYVTGGAALARYVVGGRRATALPARICGHFTNIAILG